ncbi:MAG: hypothetical protein KA143_02660 [Saprospiraceae bacterium]|nr:hypothetical protein [Saprospiraceae bacterium]
MKHTKIYNVVFVYLLVLASCSSKHALTIYEDRKEEQTYDSLTLFPSAEVFKLRHTIFKAERPAVGPMAKNNTKNVFSETAIGFDIGNHFFVDMHGNLSLRLDSALRIDTRSDFKLIKSNHKGLPIVYTRKGYEYKIRHHGLFHFEWKKKIQSIPDGFIFGRKHIQKKISFNASGILENKRNKIHELRKWNANTCSWTDGKKISYFYKNEETLLLPNQIRIVKSGSRLYYYQGTSLKGYIQKAANSLQVHEAGSKPYTIHKKDNLLELWQSGNWLLQTYICYQ